MAKDLRNIVPAHTHSTSALPDVAAAIAVEAAARAAADAAEASTRATADAALDTRTTAVETAITSPAAAYRVFGTNVSNVRGWYQLTAAWISDFTSAALAAVTWSTITGKPSTFTPSAHASTHLPGGADALTTAAPVASAPGDTQAVGTAASFARSDHKHAREAFGSTAGTVCQGNDARLSDARTPLTHAHAQSDVTGLATALAAKQDTSAKGVANGYAGLDATGKVPTSQLPGMAPTAHASTHAGGGSDPVNNLPAYVTVQRVNTGDDGGQLRLQKPLTNTTFVGDLAIDTYRDTIRIFDYDGINWNGVYLVKSEMPAGIGGKLWHSGNFDPSTKAALSHTHAESDITNLTTDLAAKVAKSGDTMTGDLTVPHVKTPGSDEPIITKGWDAFTSGAKSGFGRWGLFMEAGRMGFGFPSSYNADVMRLFKWNADSTLAAEYTIWSTYNFDPSTKLGVSAKAADSDLLDGLDGLRYAFVDDSSNRTASRVQSNSLRSGFYSTSNGLYAANGSTVAYTGWWHVLNFQHQDFNGFNAQFAMRLDNPGSGGLLARWSSFNTWSEWAKVWNEVNDGSGSGLDADLLDGYHGSLAVAANTYPLRDGNGYLYGNYFNQSSGNDENPTVYQVMVTNGSDGFFRKASLSHMRSQLGITGNPYVEANSTAGQVVTGGSTDLRYENEVYDTANAWSGTVFTAPSAGKYHFSVSTRCSTGGGLAAYVNGTLYKNGPITSSAAYVYELNGIVRLAQNDTLRFRIENVNGTRETSAVNNRLSIMKLED